MEVLAFTVFHLKANLQQNLMKTVIITIHITDLLSKVN